MIRLFWGGVRVLGVLLLISSQLSLVQTAGAQSLVPGVVGTNTASPAVPETPPAEKVDQLIGLLSDPVIQSWLAQRALENGSSAGQSAQSGGGAALSTRLHSIKAHLQELTEALPTIPAQFERARNILMLEFEDRGILSIIALVLGLTVAGLGFDRLARMATGGYRRWMQSLPTTNPRGRLAGLAARFLYAMILIAAFFAGSVGVFLIFDWPLLMREIVLTYLSVGLITWIVLKMSRVILVPPMLGLHPSQEYRALPMSDARAGHWYLYIGINTAFFLFTGATIGILKTFGFDEPGRMLIAGVVGLVQLLLLLTAVWRRPEQVKTSGSGVLLGPVAISWLLTVFFVVLWALRVSGANIAFWLLLAIVAIPVIVMAASDAVDYLFRAPEDDSASLTPVTIAVIDRGIRCVVIILAAYFLANIWGVDVSGIAQGENTQQRLLRGGLTAIVILLAADFGWAIIRAIIENRLNEGRALLPDGQPAPLTSKQSRMRTLLPIIQNVLLAVIIVMAVLMSLSAIGVEIGPLIAGAGVVGVAIGFGAQTLVKDVISGMFYLFDDAFRVGEYVETGTYRGTVESFSLRSVKLRHHRGYLTTVPFGELGAVQNMSRDWAIDKFSVTVGYDTDIDKARKLIKKLGIELAEDPEFAPHVIEPMKMQGVQNFGDYGIELRMKMKTKPGEQFTIRRKAYVRLKHLFEENGIKIPFPTVHVQGGGGGGEETDSTAAAQAAIARKMAAEAAPAKG